MPAIGAKLPAPRINLRTLEDDIIEEFCITDEELKSDSRARALVAARRAFAVRAFKAGYGCSVIARFLRRTHATILYYDGRHANR